MNREDIIRMARECGLDLHRHGWIADESRYAGLERFAALVAAAEREACAMVCEVHGNGYGQPMVLMCAQLIRARGNGGER